MKLNQIQQILGNTNLWLIDLILKEKIPQNVNILDAGCGEGRDLRFFVNNDYSIYAIDKNPMAVKMAQMSARAWNPNYPSNRIIEADILNMPFSKNFFDIIICNNVLHHTASQKEAIIFIKALVDVLNTNGKLYIYMASSLFVNIPSKYSFRITHDVLHTIRKNTGVIIKPIKTYFDEYTGEMSLLVIEKNS